jgi:mRNA-degrading endonuclease RelE of RelBE toxin-antitoxin system
MRAKVYQLQITPEALAEIQEAVYYYNSKRKGLGKEFFQELKKDLAKVKKNPFSFSPRYDDVRWIAMNRFPYAVHYTVIPENKIIIIQAILSQHRDPEVNWKKRL